jgi:hypothetical protein
MEPMMAIIATEMADAFANLPRRLGLTSAIAKE